MHSEIVGFKGWAAKSTRIGDSSEAALATQKELIFLVPASSLYSPCRIGRRGGSFPGLLRCNVNACSLAAGSSCATAGRRREHSVGRRRAGPAVGRVSGGRGGLIRRGVSRNGR